MQASDIDWSKAPKWATGHGLAGLSGSPVWLSQDKYTYVDGRQRGGVFYFDSDEGFGLHEIREVVARPSPWNGTGLPPVGTVCEVNLYGWRRCEVFAHKVEGDKDPDILFSYTRDDGEPAWNWVRYPSRFRPIRTPEQIAADEREKAVADMKLIWAKAGSHRFHAIYDAGYRKVEGGEA